MAHFPTVVGTPTQPTAVSGNLNLTIPAGTVAGNLLIAIVSADSDSGATMTGWTRKVYGANGTFGQAVWVRIADGSDSGTVTGASKARVAHVYAVEDWSGDLDDVLVAATNANSIDPPSLNMGTAEDILWIAAARSNSTINSTNPTSFTDVIVTNYFGASWTASARRQFNPSPSTSLNPATFSGTTNSAHAVTIGIDPAPEAAPIISPPSINRARLTRASHF